MFSKLLRREVKYESLLTINIRTAERKRTKSRVTNKVADLPGAVGPVRPKIMVNKGVV